MQETQGSNLEDPWRRKWQPTPVFLPAESDGQRSLEGCSPRGRPESDTTERLSRLLLRQVRPGRSSAPSPLTAPISPRVKDKDLTVFSVDAHTSTPPPPSTSAPVLPAASHGRACTLAVPSSGHSSPRGLLGQLPPPSQLPPPQGLPAELHTSPARPASPGPALSTALKPIIQCSLLY